MNIDWPCGFEPTENKGAKRHSSALTYYAGQARKISCFKKDQNEREN